MGSRRTLTDAQIEGLRPMLFTQAMKLSRGNRDEAEDMVQEALIRVSKAPLRDGNLGAFATVVLKNAYRDLLFRSPKNKSTPPWVGSLDDNPFTRAGAKGGTKRTSLTLDYTDIIGGPDRGYGEVEARMVFEEVLAKARTKMTPAETLVFDAMIEDPFVGGIEDQIRSVAARLCQKYKTTKTSWHRAVNRLRAAYTALYPQSAV